MSDSYAPIYSAELTETVEYIEKAFGSVLENVDRMRFTNDNNTTEAYLNRASLVARGSIQRIFILHFLDLNWRLEGALGSQERYICEKDFKSKQGAGLLFAVKKHKKDRSGRASPSDSQAEIAIQAESSNKLGSA